MSSSNYCFQTCIQISQEADQVFWYSPHDSVPSSPPTRASSGSPALSERLDVQFSEPWYQAAASQKEALPGKGRKALPLKSSRRSSLRLAEQGRKALKLRLQGLQEGFCTQTDSEMPFSSETPD